MYKVKRFNEEKKSEKLFSDKELKELDKEAKEIVDFVNKKYPKTMEILGK